MLESLKSLIVCPFCKSDNFDYEITEKNNEIRKGAILCRTCFAEYPIENGIVDLLANPSEQVLNEIKENEKVCLKRKNKTDNWLLALPLSDNFGNEKFRQINRGYLENIKTVMAMVEIKGKVVLEIGAGTCWLTSLYANAGALPIATEISTEKYVGLLSADVFMKAQGVFFERVRCSMEILPFKDNIIDVAVVNAAIHHSSNIKKTFSEIGRVLKPGGSFLLTNEAVCPIFRINRKVTIEESNKTGMDAGENTNENMYSYRNYKRYLSECGFNWKLVFPPSFDMLLSNRDELSAIVTYKKYIGLIGSIFWKINSIRNIIKYLFPLYLFLFGGNLVLVARKKNR